MTPHLPVLPALTTLATAALLLIPISTPVPATPTSGQSPRTTSDSTPDTRRPPTRAWPVRGPTTPRPNLLRGWAPPPTPWAAGHRGVDLAATPGQPVRAAAPGRVTFAGRVAGRGVVTVELRNSGHPPLRTTHEPLRPTVRTGDRVRTGTTIGTLAPQSTAHCPTTCLHWGLRRTERYLNPLSLLPPGMLHTPTRLLPLTPSRTPQPPAHPDTHTHTHTHTPEHT
ncbi:M23 family peptidase [Streptomyces sp. AJS327]|uniref:M23 family metallopeptidase n=1 Tax=Streptomyces sp. AJS327 TaxID=2545265 RepID=UPI0015DDC885|nr:M23 family metallopeptidase [Streptomyces sp. AJS327]MBA0051826.1 M23 family peptidase [Streptomyces sp. AJS327]